MQKVGSATETGEGPGQPPEPRPKAGRSDRGRRTALWLALGAIGGGLAALAVVGLGLALTGAGEPVAVTPRFVKESAAAGVHHVYGGEFPFFVGGGVATFDCNGDRRPDLDRAARCSVWARAGRRRRDRRPCRSRNQPSASVPAP